MGTGSRQSPRTGGRLQSSPDKTDRANAAVRSDTRLARRTALLDRLLQHPPELRRILMAVNLDRMLHGNFDEFLFAVSGYCDRTSALGRHFSAIDIFSGHGCLLGLENQKSHLLSRTF